METMNTKRLTLNMAANIISFCVNLAINFFITPYIVEQLGEAAYGFVKLANDFANYAALVTLALNSMAVRYILIHLSRGEKKEAVSYYNSVILANVVLSVFLLIPSAIVVGFLDKFLDIPDGLAGDVRITFVIVFLNFLINLIFSTTGQCFYLTDKLYLSSLRSMESTLIRMMTIIVLFLIFQPSIVLFVCGSLTATFYIIVMNIHYRRKLLPDMPFRPDTFEIKKVKTLISSGIWNSVTKLSQILSSGLDLLITNILIDASAMGILSVAKTIPLVVVSFNSSLSNVFNPNLTRLYAQEKKEELKSAVITSMRIMSVFAAIPNAILVSIGMQFYSLWVPDQPALMLQILSVLTVINSVITGTMSPVYELFTITNKVKQNSIVMLIYGACSILGTLLCIELTNLGVYAVAGVSLIGSLIVAFCYHLPFGAYYLGLKKTTFFPVVGKSAVSFILCTVIGYGFSLVISCNDWFGWFMCAIATGICGLVLNILLVLKKEERRMLYDRLKSKLRSK